MTAKACAIDIYTVRCSGSCQRCHKIHHHIIPEMISAPYVTAFECGGAAVRYDHLQIGNVF